MSELRWDPIKLNWVIIAPERGKHWNEVPKEQSAEREEACPFCYGNEGKTPGEIFAVRPEGPPNSPGWKVRVIPNRHPVLRIEGELKSRAYGMYDVMTGIGAHEIIIETPDHEKGLADLSIAEITDVLNVYRSRLLDLSRDLRFRYLVLFKNHGFQAGATLSHSHSQLIAVPLAPPVSVTEMRVCREFYDRKQRCLFCDIIEFELQSGERIVNEFSDFIIMAPYASCFPFELRLLPKKHSHDYTLLDNAQLAELATAMKDMLSRLKNALNDPPYNFILHTTPPMHARPGKPDFWSSIEFDYHWHIELVPRLSRVAGFEWGTGFHINPTAPEDAAAFLREIDI
jgi:UDPglucose--hexose-1-phosphate uridylyltransferase